MSLFKKLGNDDFIIETNKTCYDNLGELYTDGEHDLKVLMEIGAWEDFLKNLSGKKVLNVGCGLGDASAELISHGYDVTNTDLSEKMVEAAQTRCPKAKNLVLSANETSKLKDVDFNGIMAIHLIQHLSKTLMLDFFKQIHEKLSERGVFFLVFTNTCYEKSGCQLDGSEVAGNKIFWHKWMLEDVVSLIVKASLKPIKMYQQKFIDKDGGYMEPFVLICKKDGN